MVKGSDIIEIRLYDPSYDLYYKGKAKIKNKKDMIKLKKEINCKCSGIFNDGWFD